MKILVLLLSGVILFLGVQTSSGQDANRVYVIENDKSGSPIAIEKPDVSWTKIDQVLGNPCKDYDRGVAYKTISSSVQFVVAKMGAHGLIGMHKSPEVAPCYIAKGQGNVVLPGGKKMAFKEGDLFVFRPDTLHGWENTSDSETIILAVIIPQMK